MRQNLVNNFYEKTLSKTENNLLLILGSGLNPARPSTRKLFKPNQGYSR